MCGTRKFYLFLVSHIMFFLVNKCTRRNKVSKIHKEEVTHFITFSVV